jgi:predicted anti-sigma-YlaC factor YlaD
MRCDEIKEQLIDFVYDEAGALQSNSEVQEHLRACSACREEVEELKRTRKYLRLWEEEPPLRSVSLTKLERSADKRAGYRYLRYAAVAAMVFISLLALVNAQVSWNQNGFAFSTRLFPRQNAEQDFYTKAEIRNLMKEALNYTNETNYLMMQKMLDTVEQDRWRDIRLIRDQVTRNQN